MVVFCAASVTDVVSKVSDDEKVSLQSGGSRALVEQFKAGAKADLLLLADSSLEDEFDELSVSTVRFASNSLVLVRPAAGSRESDLSTPRTTLAVADPRTAPLGVYTRQALLPEGTPARRILLKDAAAVVSAVRMAHADLGVVYATDLRNASDLELVRAFDPRSHDRVEYLALLPLPARPQARRLLEKLTSPEGLAALKDEGFTEAQ